MATRWNILTHCPSMCDYWHSEYLTVFTNILSRGCIFKAPALHKTNVLKPHFLLSCKCINHIFGTLLNHQSIAKICSHCIWFTCISLASINAASSTYKENLYLQWFQVPHRHAFYAEGPPMVKANQNSDSRQTLSPWSWAWAIQNRTHNQNNNNHHRTNDLHPGDK